MIIQENFKHFRKAAGLTQTELAEKANLSPFTVQKCESVHSFSIAKKSIAALAIAMNVKISDIFTYGEFINANPFDFITKETEEYFRKNGITRENWEPTTSMQNGKEHIIQAEKTPFGDITISSKTDYEYPGFYIDLKGPNVNDVYEKGTSFLCTIEYHPLHNHLQIVIYGNGNSDEPTHIIPFENIIKQKEE